MTTANNVPQIYSLPLAHPYSFKQRSYQVLKLSNGIHGLIITDPTEDLATCCLSIAAGHHSNPNEIPGLAHLCEHMITLSSKNYSTPELYKKLVHDAGGTLNALTSNEISSFHFSIPITPSKNTQSDFENILDIFVSNFANPTFESSFSNREIFAVDNEHTVNKSRKNRLSFQGYKLLANKNHQFSRFSTGDFTSLTESCKKYDIRSKLLEFYKSEYLPEKMSFVLRGPQSLNYLQKLAISNFSKIGMEKSIPINLKPKISSNSLNINITELYWKDKYSVPAYTRDCLMRAVLIDKDLDSVLRVGFPISLKNSNSSNNRQLSFFINYWCEIFGSDSTNTVSSALFKRDLISDIMTKTATVTYDNSIIEIEMALTEKGIGNIYSIINIIFNYISLFQDDNDSKSFSKFTKHLAKSMSQFNGIGIYNFLYAETPSQSNIEAKNLSTNLLHDVKKNGQFFITGDDLYDDLVSGFCGAYGESEKAKQFWISEAVQFCEFVKNNFKVDNLLVSYVGNISKINLDWLDVDSSTSAYEKDFDFNYKIFNIKSNINDLSNYKSYELNLSPPNEFADEIIQDQTKLLQMVKQTAENSADASLGFSVKNLSIMDVPKLYHSDAGCQLWVKTEVNDMFANRAFFSMELINTKIGESPINVATLEVLIQLVKHRVKEYLYPAMIMHYSYDVCPSLKGDSGILLNVSGPRENFTKVLAIIVYEIKLVASNFKSSITPEEFDLAKNAVLLRFKNALSMPSIESVTLGMMAIIEEDTWLVEERIEALESLTFSDISSIVPNLFSSCYLSALLEGEVDGLVLKNDVLPILAKLVDKFEGENHSFPSSVVLPTGSNYFAKSTTKDKTNAIDYFIQTCLRDNMVDRSITKFLSFIMGAALTAKIRTEYQLGYIVFVGLKNMRKTQGIHISVVSGSHTAAELDGKLDDIVNEWYEQSINKMKQSQLDTMIEKFLAAESAANTVNSNHFSNALFGILGGSAGDVKSMKQHNSYWQQIENKTYLFSSNLQGEDIIDLNAVKSLKVGTIQSFIKSKILPTSKLRSKVAVFINSTCSKEKIEKNYQGMQIFVFLSSMGLPIKQEHLEDIMEKSGNSQVSLCKNLYKYYREKGKSIALIASAMAKLSTSLIFSTSGSTSSKIVAAVPAIEIELSQLHEWQKHTGLYRDPVTLHDKLYKFK